MKKNKEYHNKKGQLHREDGPAVELADGYKAYYVNGKRHREDGPAVEWASGSKEYWVNGQLHREDGPAVERADGYKAYWINGQKMSEQDFKNRKKPNNISSTGTQDFKYELKERIRSILENENFFDKVETHISDSIIDDLSEISLMLRDIQKRLLKSRPKLIDDLAKAINIIEDTQNKLS